MALSMEATAVAARTSGYAMTVTGGTELERRSSLACASGLQRAAAVTSLVRSSLVTLCSQAERVLTRFGDLPFAVRNVATSVVRTSSSGERGVVSCACDERLARGPVASSDGWHRAVQGDEQSEGRSKISRTVDKGPPNLANCSSTCSGHNNVSNVQARHNTAVPGLLKFSPQAIHNGDEGTSKQRTRSAHSSPHRHSHRAHTHLQQQQGVNKLGLLVLVVLLQSTLPSSRGQPGGLFGGGGHALHGENDGVTASKQDCSRLCRRYLREADSYLDVDQLDPAQQSERCDAMYRLIQCLGTVDFTASRTGHVDPAHGNCDLNFEMLLAQNWALDMLRTTCAGAIPPAEDACNVSKTCPSTRQGGGGAADKRRQLPAAVCAARALHVCQLFGDRHLIRTDGVLETCLLPGRWPLVQFDRVGVYTANTPYLDKPRLNQLYPMINETSNLQMVEISLTLDDYTTVRYTASASSLYLVPLFVLADGETHVSEVRLDGRRADGDGGENDDQRVARIWADGENHLRTVEITLPWLCTVIVLRLFSHSLTVSIAMPTDQRDVLRRHGFQLCRQGCAPKGAGLVARYEWTGSKCSSNGEGGGLRESFSKAERQLNLTASTQAQHECMNILQKLGPSIYLSACRWDVALRASRPRDVRRQFSCGAEFAAHDAECLPAIATGGAPPNKCKNVIVSPPAAATTAPATSPDPGKTPPPPTSYTTERSTRRNEEAAGHVLKTVPALENSVSARISPPEFVVLTMLGMLLLATGCV
ncbi:uncharacterized protein LOC135819203 [Sycon ciliatum]|uniref:uncharacterized protein LOC135819203 n=1 Tax=Sycon ciliatum TaxID=27933 RepID=UPI0031F65E9F